MNNLPERMAKAHYEKKFEHIDDDFILMPWELIPNKEIAARIAHMKAALEILKNPPEELLEAMVEHMYAMARRVDLGDTYLDETDMQRLLKSAINQTLKTHEQHTEHFSAKDDKGWDFSNTKDDEDGMV